MIRVRRAPRAALCYRALLHSGRTGATLWGLADQPLLPSGHPERSHGASAATEYNLLALLSGHAGKVVTHQAILHAIWGPTFGHRCCCASWASSPR
ncbi:MAG: winged helix-turn-helix domain-containing protein [Chloroflexales bacterium]|nr:winged helix-turn-helix domain-containing protein [Chloroflexales bacterium]